MINITHYLKTQSEKIDRALLGCLPKNGERISHLYEAMRYAVTSGGKRIRPVLLLEAARAVGGPEAKAMPAACAVELVHNYSLIHDDLPCMDDDSVRRARPTCHVKFGEVTALLAGDALLTLAFEVLSRTKRIEAVQMLAEAAGGRGMVGGQALDMEFQNKEPDIPTIEYINTHKSGSLIAVSLRMGAVLGGGTKRQIESLYRYGKVTGLLFQIVDDMLDGEGYAKALGLSSARQKAEELGRQAKKELSGFGRRADILHWITDFVLERKH